MQIDIPLSKPQAEFVFCDAAHPAMVAGLGAGKTYAATIRFLLIMLQEPGINTLLAMPTYDLLKMRAIPGFEEVLTQIGLPFKTNKSEYKIEIIGYGLIYFRSYDRPERLVAFEVAHSICDELDTLPKDKAELVWRKISERTRQKCKGKNTIGAVTTPDQGIHGFIYQNWVKKKGEGYQLVKASTLSNPYLPDSYVEQIRANYDPILAELYINGEFVSLSQSKVYHFFDRQKHHTDREIQERERLYVGVDFNVGGCCAVVFVIDGKNPVAVDEFVSHDTRDFCNNLWHRYPEHSITVYPDASGGANRTNASATDIEIIENEGFAVDAPEKNPFVRDRINAMNGLLAHDRLMVNCNKCPEFTYALESQGYDDKGDPEKFKEHPAIDDWVDCSGYFIHQRYPIREFVAGPRAG